MHCVLTWQITDGRYPRPPWQSGKDICLVSSFPVSFSFSFFPTLMCVGGRVGASKAIVCMSLQPLLERLSLDGTLALPFTRLVQGLADYLRYLIFGNPYPSSDRFVLASFFFGMATQPTPYFAAHRRATLTAHSHTPHARS